MSKTIAERLIQRANEAVDEEEILAINEEAGKAMQAKIISQNVYMQIRHILTRERS